MPIRVWSALAIVGGYPRTGFAVCEARPTDEDFAGILRIKDGEPIEGVLVGPFVEAFAR